MLHQYLIGRTIRTAIGKNGFVWEISAGFASRAAKTGSRQVAAGPFTQVLLEFHDHVMSPNLQLAPAVTAQNEKSLTKLHDFAKTLASSTTTYASACSQFAVPEHITFMEPRQWQAFENKCPAAPDWLQESRQWQALDRNCPSPDAEDLSRGFARTLCRLFAETGAPSDLRYWGDGTWTLTGKKPDESGVQQDVDDAEMKLRVELRGLVPLLVMLAALPWVDPDEDDGQNVPYINHVKGFVLDAVEGRGWDVRSGVLKIWAGERDLDTIVGDTDARSARALEEIMQAALKYQQHVGTIKTI